jgi:hypothetical protein
MTITLTFSAVLVALVASTGLLILHADYKSAWHAWATRAGVTVTILTVMAFAYVTTLRLIAEAK